MGMCVVIFWILGLIAAWAGATYLYNVGRITALMVNEGIAEQFIESYDNRHKTVIFWTSWAVSAATWYLFYLRGHWPLAGILVFGCILYEVAKRKIRKELPKMMAASFIYNVQNFLKGE